MADKLDRSEPYDYLNLHVESDPAYS